ncbi:Vinorine synthase [Bertholletia excelsa]
MKVEVISKTFIKPSSPTPPRLRILQLSFLDQIAVPTFMPIVFFYPPVLEAAPRRKSQLKESLSETLTQFYPLAGRVKDRGNLVIECNDDGVPFFEAQVCCELSEVLAAPQPGEFNKLLPYGLHDAGDLTIAVQLNTFDGGGMAVGICVSHKVADALSMFTFINSWAAISRGSTDIPRPRFGQSDLFPPRDLSGYKPATGVSNDKIVTKRFIFSSTAINSLRARYTDGSTTARRPTRIEALSVFIWARFAAATRTEDSPKKTSTVLHALNLRTRVDPPLTEHHFGNLSSFAVAEADEENDSKSGSGLVNALREAIKRVDGEFVRRLREGDGSDFLRMMKERAAKYNGGEMVSFRFTSLCRFPLYEADFGWGEPSWVGSASLAFKNLVVFMDTKGGDGIDVWVNLLEDDMEKFQADEELLAFASPAASVVKG